MHHHGVAGGRVWAGSVGTSKAAKLGLVSVSVKTLRWWWVTVVGSAP